MKKTVEGNYLLKVFFSVMQNLIFMLSSSGKVLVQLTFFTVGQSVLEIERAVGEDLVAVGAGKALGVEVRRHRLQAVLRREKFREDFW